jgi:protein-tyrosine phosphatase
LEKLFEGLKRAVARVTGRAEPEPAPTHRVLFVCMGNICRSPTAEGVMRKLLEERAPDLRIEVASAGTHAYHVGEPPDPRARRAAERRGVDLSSQRARRVAVEDFAYYDLVLAMDPLNRATLLELSPPEFHHRIRLLLEFAPQLGREDVPDPYYGGGNGFEYVLDLVEEASLGVIEHLRRSPPPAVVDDHNPAR